jgi:hypothetical protein
MKYDRLQPLPIFGLFYRFHVDATGPLRASRAGYKYVIIIVEAFSKWIDLVPLRELTAKAVATVFNERVLARYGAPVEVVTDRTTRTKLRVGRVLCEGMSRPLVVRVRTLACSPSAASYLSLTCLPSH